MSARPSQPTVAVNARAAQSNRPTGIPRYITSLYEALERLDAPERFVFLQTARRRPPLGPRTETLPTSSGTLGAARFDLFGADRLLGRQPAGTIFHGPAQVLPWRRRPGYRYVVTVHDLSFLEQPEHYPWNFRQYFRWAIGRAVRNADAVVADSANTGKDLQHHYRLSPDRLRVVPLGVDQIFLTNTPRPRLITEPYLLTVTTHPKRKNLPRLLEAFARARSLHNRTLVVSGLIPPTQRRRLENQITLLKLSGSVKLLGYVSENDLHSLYQHADCFVYPSLYEGFGLPLLEAMAAGTPVIAADASCLPEIMPDRRWLVDPHDVAAIAAKMEEIVQLSPAQRRGLINRQRRHAKRYTWTATARAMRSIFQEVASHAR